MSKVYCIDQLPEEVNLEPGVNEEVTDSEDCERDNGEMTSGVLQGAMFIQSYP